MDSIQDILDYVLFSIGSFSFKVHMVVMILLILIITRFILWIIKKMLFRRSYVDEHEKGNIHAVYQIIRYVLWIVAFGLILETLGIKLTLLLAGSAALLVGIGLGLQQTFNDIISGFILLTERSIRIGDVLEVEGNVIKIQSIGIRTSKGLNTDDISIIIPNSLITTNKVINWSHQSDKTRFRIDVGVAYGSNVDQVIQIMEESAFEHPDVYDRELTEGRLMRFGSSSLDFQLLFFSKNIFRIGSVKSDIRRIIVRKFNENGITIAFPQLDVHIKQNET
ncbi:MAG: mechanosensitive ion channel [Bacteroidia bacterium]|nr:mechanosensitive ion channel [Bacteroidia bacterium]NNF29940.1 mechanosensitive ion channel [Flavobacteriaceae bacterium]MBT8276080.1 mechanosensitive ion channel [Bacteroidia bacterium]NNJ82471.1 mechanosensitive ion channel [Flavobacteriaceae bacterium]NNK53645.1 mechanosensitive ion channel [Flavobacteriaceae bacterium]